MKAWYDRLAEKETEVDDLYNIRKMKQLKKDLEKLIEREKKGEAMVQEMEEKVKIIRGAIEQGEKEADVLRKDALDSDVLVVVTQWFGDQGNMNNELRQAQSIVKYLQIKISEFQGELTKRKVDERNYKAEFEVFERSLVEKEKALEKEKSELEIRHRLAEYAEELQEGKPC